MKWIKHSVVLASLIALFVLGSTSTVIPVEKNVSKEQRLQSAESIQSVGLIQSISENQQQVVSKVNKTSFSNYFLHLFEVSAIFIIKPFSLFLAHQDTTPCESFTQSLLPSH